MRFVISLGLLVMLCSVVFNSGDTHALYPWEVLSPEKVVQVIREIEGDPKVQAQILGKSVRFTAPFPLLGRSPLVYRAFIKDKEYEYEVSVRTPLEFSFSNLRRYRAKDFYGELFDPKRTPLITLEECEKIARAFVVKRFPDARALQWVGHYRSINTPNKQSDKVPDYTFLYMGKTPEGVSLPQWAAVHVEAVKGQVVGYYQFFYPVLVPTLKSNLSVVEAESHAIAELTRGNVERYPQAETGLYVTDPDPLGAQRLVWKVGIRGEAKHKEEEDFSRHIALVAADTGELIARDGVMVEDIDSPKRSPTEWPQVNIPPQLDWSKRVKVLIHVPWHYLPEFEPNHPDLPEFLRRRRGEAHLVYRPIVVGSTPMLWIGYLAAKDWKLTKAGAQEWSLSRMSEVLRLKEGTREASIGKRVIKMPEPPQTIAGVTYVPVCLLEITRNLVCEFDAANRTLLLKEKM